MNKSIKALLCGFTVTVSFCSLVGCSQSKPSNERVENRIPILAELEATRGKGILFGHQDDLAYGVGWKYIDGESDVKRIAGDYPALFGWELGGLELGHKFNLDSVPFSKMHDFAVWAFNHAGINTFSWHPHSPIDSISAWHGDSVVVPHILPGGEFNAAFNSQLDKVADFFKSLKDSVGSQIPFIFRPWHEMDGDWFWWGSNACTPEEYKSLFRYTIEYLRERGLSNMVVAYSPDCKFESPEQYLTWYPGDDVVDILGTDNYWDFKQVDGEKMALKKLQMVVKLAQEKSKFSALTETGSELVPDSTWYTQKLGYVLNDSIIMKNLSYAMVWRSASTEHFFFPYPGQAGEVDAKTLLDQPNILLLKDLKQIK